MNEPDPVRAWEFAMKLLADEELARIDAMSEAEVERELAALGIDAAEIPSAERLLAKTAQRPSVTPLASAKRASRGRGSLVVWLVAAAFAAVAVVIAGTKAPAIVAWWKGPPMTSPEADAMPELWVRSSLAHAESLRNEAARACEEGLFGACEQRLDEARALDKDGEAQDKVVRMRAKIDDARRLEPGDAAQEIDSKPRLHDPRLPKP